MRSMVAKELVKMAKRIVFDEDIVFVREDGVDDRMLNEIWREIGTFLDRIRRNEGIETYSARTDNGSAMEISIGLDRHENKRAILKAVIDHAKKLGRRAKVRVIASEVEDAARPQ
jgi:hypothetical protein